KTSDFFYYYLFKMNITSAVREVIDGNINAKPKYTKVEEIVEESEQNNKAIASVLRTDLINKINLELSVSDKKLIVLNEKIAIIDSKATPKVLVDPAEIMNIGYVKKILNNAKEDLLNNDLDSVVTKSRTIIETVFIEILRKHQIDFKENGNIGHYRSLVNKTLGMKPDNRWDENVSSLISGLNKIVDSITTMRNINSDSHGSSNRVKINEAEAELILNSAVNISVYYLRVDGRKEKNSVNITKTS
ncbi:TPA: abortive infection family protein, partial [Streptococcus pyogenes]